MKSFASLSLITGAIAFVMGNTAVFAQTELPAQKAAQKAAAPKPAVKKPAVKRKPGAKKRR